MDDKTYRRSMAAVVAVGAAIAIGTVTGTAASFDRIAAHAKSDVAATQPASDDSGSSMDEQLLGPHADTTGTQDAENATKQDTDDNDAKSDTKGTDSTKSDATSKDSTKQDTKADADADQTVQEPAPTSGQTDASVGAAAGSAKIQTYDVQWGDTLSGVSRSTGVSVDDLARENGIENVDLIYAGSSLRVPQD
jgi:LysM repeat protein